MSFENPSFEKPKGESLEEVKKREEAAIQERIKNMRLEADKLIEQRNELMQDRTLRGTEKELEQKTGALRVLLNKMEDLGATELDKYYENLRYPKKSG